MIKKRHLMILSLATVFVLLEGCFLSNGIISGNAQASQLSTTRVYVEPPNDTACMHAYRIMVSASQVPLENNVADNTKLSSDPVIVLSHAKVKVYVCQPLGYIPFETPGDSQAVNITIMIETGGISDGKSGFPSGIVGWGLNLQVDPDVLDINTTAPPPPPFPLPPAAAKITGGKDGFFLMEYTKTMGLPTPTFMGGRSNPVTGYWRDIAEALMPNPGYGAGNYTSGLYPKLVTIQVTSKSDTQPCWIDIVSAYYKLWNGTVYPVEIIEDGYYGGPPPPPVASFTYSPSEPLAGEAITFDATASYDPDGTIDSYLWHFGDGTNSTGMIATHTYTTAGTYNATLIVTDSEGLIDMTSKSIAVAKLSSTISISGFPTSISLGESTVINGSITPAHVGASVTIWYKTIGKAWGTLEPVITDENSQYTCFWTPSDTRTYKVKASWLGDENTLPAQSSIVTIDVIPPRALSIELSGEHDYLFMEAVKMRLTAHVKDATTLESVSNANVTIEIYGPDGNLWVSDRMVERLASTGIYEWESGETIRILRLEKGVYLSRVTASSEGSLTISDILQFHIDPLPEEPVQTHLILLFVLATAWAIAVSVWYLDHRRLSRKIPELQRKKC